MRSIPEIQIAFSLLRAELPPGAVVRIPRERAQALAALLVIDLFDTAASDVCPSCWQLYANGVPGKAGCSGDCVFAY